MNAFLIKTLVSALLIAAISELGKRSSTLAAILASLPLTSILALLWLYRDTESVEKISALSLGIFWAVLPSLLFFLILPLLLKNGMRFGWAMAISCGTMAVAYSAYVYILRRLGVEV